MKEILGVTARDNYILEIEFADGMAQEVDVKPLLDSPAFQSIRDRDFFARASVDYKFGGVAWPNGVDICIDWIEAQLELQNRKSRTA